MSPLVKFNSIEIRDWRISASHRLGKIMKLFFRNLFSGDPVCQKLIAPGVIVGDTL
jgi:hypothetical protein